MVMLRGSGPGASGVSNYSRNIDALAQHHRVIVSDMPGYGRSVKCIDQSDPFGYLADMIPDYSTHPTPTPRTSSATPTAAPRRCDSRRTPPTTVHLRQAHCAAHSGSGLVVRPRWSRQSVNDFGEFFTQRSPGPVGARPKVCVVRDESAPQERQFVRKGCFMGGVLERLQTAMYLTLTAAFLGVALSALVAVLVAAAPLKLLALIDRHA